jgi:outer membrane protein TolC
MFHSLTLLKLTLTFIFLTGCNFSNIEQLGKNSKSFFSNQMANLKSDAGEPKPIKPNHTLEDLVDDTHTGNTAIGKFSESLKEAILVDPNILSAKQEYLAKLSEVDIIASQQDFQVTGTLYGGIEDVSDKTTGLAVVLNATRPMYDGGLLDARTLSKRLSAESAQHAIYAQIDKRIYELAVLWIDLERYQVLNDKIEKRLAVLDPLISQLEQVAEAGVGDASQVAAAQRTVSSIRVTRTDVREKLEISKINFANAFGGLPANPEYDDTFISNLKPTIITNEMIKLSPAIQADYAAYKAAEANLVSVKAQDGYKVGFESRFTRPIGGSEYDSDESLGFVVRKTFYQGKKLQAEITKSEALIDSIMAKLSNTKREGDSTVKKALQSIKSMNTAIELSRESAQVTSDEITYLRRQLIIGGSTLDSVLSAEARFYDAETKEINFLADKRKAELLVLSSLGFLSEALGLRVF